LFLGFAKTACFPSLNVPAILFCGLYLNKNIGNTFCGLEALLEFYVLSVMAVLLKTSFYTTATTLTTSTIVATRPQKEKQAVCSKPKNSFSAKLYKNASEYESILLILISNY
jgi:hypothetical protein